MLNKFQSISPEELSGNFIKRIGRQWFLLASGGLQRNNMLTGSWGEVGMLFHKPVFTVFVRENRYTLQLLDSNEYFTVNFFGEGFRETLQFCGTRSGRDLDKVRESGLTVFEPVPGVIGFQEADEVVVCRKIQRFVFDPEQLLDEQLKRQYQAGVLHIGFTGIIEQLLIAEK